MRVPLPAAGDRVAQSLKGGRPVGRGVFPRRARWRSLVIAGAAVLTAGTAAAQQQRRQVPDSTDPGLIDRQFQQPAAPRATRPASTINVPDRGQRPAQADSIRLRLDAIELVGATAFTIEDLRDAWAPLMGQEISLGAIFDVAETLTTRYRAAGYILSQVIVPAQEIRNGTVRLQVVEGYVSEVRVESPPNAPAEAIRRYMGTVMAERPMTTATLERVLLLINDLPDVTAETILSPSDNGTGAAMVTVQVRQKRSNAFASVDNRGTVFLGPVQYSAGGDVNGAFLREDQLSTRFITTAPTRELRYGEVGYETTLAPSGDKLRFRFSHNATQPTDSLTSLEVEGRGTSVSLGYERPILRSRAENLSLEGRFTVRNSETRLLSAAFSDDRIRSIALLGSYDIVDRVRGISLMQGGLWQGLDILGETESGSANLSRANGRSDFTKLTAAASRLQGLWGNFSLFTAFNGQYAFSQLLAPEDFGVGGSQYGHAYDSAEISGDHGVAGAIELQYGGAVAGLAPLQAYQLHAGYDGGMTWRIAERASGRDSIASTSTGIRLQLMEGVSASFELAKPLTAEPATQRNDNLRAFFSLTLRR